MSYYIIQTAPQMIVTRYVIKEAPVLGVNTHHCTRVVTASKCSYYNCDIVVMLHMRVTATLLSHVLLQR